MGCTMEFPSLLELCSITVLAAGGVLHLQLGGLPVTLGYSISGVLPFASFRICGGVAGGDLGGCCLSVFQSFVLLFSR
jgi:hypothetical protein